MNTQRQAHRILSTVVRELARDKKVQSTLKALKKKETELKRDDFVWHRILCSFSTWGNTNGYEGLINNEKNYSQVTFEALAKLNLKNRLKTLERVLKRSGVRYHINKAKYLSDNFDKINQMGGQEAAKRCFLKLDDEDSLRKYFDDFKGIGPKYARNILMDIYHPKFRNCVAVDQRIFAIAEALGLQFNTFSEAEDFFLDVAKTLGIDGWDIDRILYNFKNIVLNKINAIRDTAKLPA